ncbi:N-acetyl sugar amidotransferase [Thalassospira sp. MIT1370]|uniref:N-acetyl sugar amidotransferase n=1 Tax=unclassified Thalassospira TaxID=2648997 RepID=UPI003999FC8D
MRHCTKCLYPENHALGITFNEDGICSGCLIHEEKNKNIWDNKEKELNHLLNNYKLRNKKNYDCIIPISGGKDSLFIAHTIKNTYNLNPLLVTYNRYYNTAGGVYNIELIRSAIGCDIIAQTPNPARLRKLTRMSLELVGSIHWPYLAGATTFPVQVAAQKGIPLIIWGAHQGLEQVGMFSHFDNVEMSKWYRNEHDLMALAPEEIVPQDHGLSTSDLASLFYPQDDIIRQKGIRGIYLGNYIRWDTKMQHEEMHKIYPVYREQQHRTFDNYSDPDCLIYNTLHDEIKFRKFGYSVVNDHVAREIRHGRITTSQGLQLIRKYRNQATANLGRELKILDISQKEIFDAVDKHRDPRVWKKTDSGWELNSIESCALSGEGELTLEEKAKYTEFLPRRIGRPSAHRILLKGGS